MRQDHKFDSDFAALCALCDHSIPRDDRLRLAQSFSQHAFAEAEQQVVFESIRALLSYGEVTVARLNVHLNNRGFPDTDVEKYFRPSPNSPLEQAPSEKTKP